MSQPTPKRVIALIDGYNLYHAIDETGRDDLKWLDLHTLCTELIRGIQGAHIAQVIYFSAFATWKPEQYARHRAYVAALKTTGVKVILGNFKKKQRHCNRCKSEWIAHEEKETDVNIALHLLNMAYRDEYDEALIVSADTDLTPALAMVRNQFEHKSLTIVLPIGRQFVSSLINASHHKIRLSLELLEKCTFPNELTTNEGKIISKPSKYNSQ